MRRRTYKLLALVFTVATLLLVVAYTQLPLQYIDNLPDYVEISWGDIDSLDAKNLTFEVDIAQPTSIDGDAQGYINVKAFRFFPLKKVKVKVESNRKVYSGGQPIGLMLNSNGVMIVGSGNIQTIQGVKGSVDLKKGDIIKKINSTHILKPKDIADFFKKHDGKPIELTIDRNGKSLTFKTQPLYDEINKEYKLGVWIKDSITGLGTVSYVRLDGRFGALGHPVVDSDTNLMFPIYSGQVYDAKVVGVEKGQSGKAGALKGTFNSYDKCIGSVHDNNKYGIFGKLDIYSQDKMLPIGSRLSVKPGKAKIISTVNSKCEEYDIEIIKTHSQKKKSDKSMVIKVTDARLLETTGGIVQGMSGSPILQDGKVVGAITHVFVNDPTRGYGIYLDWMIDN